MLNCETHGVRQEETDTPDKFRHDDMYKGLKMAWHILVDKEA